MRLCHDPKELRNALGASPFRPFRIHFGSGRTIDVRHPEFAVIGPTGRTAVIYDVPKTPSQEQGDSFQVIDVMLVEALEFIQDKSGNGAKKKPRGRKKKN